MYTNGSHPPLIAPAHEPEIPCGLDAVIKARRQELGWTQEELADRMAAAGDDTFRQSDVSRLERGKVELPHRQRLGRLAEVLGLSLGELLALSGWAGGATMLTIAEPPLARQDAAREPAMPDTEITTESMPRAERPKTLPEELSSWSRVRELIAEAAATREHTRAILANSEALLRDFNSRPLLRRISPDQPSEASAGH